MSLGALGALSIKLVKTARAVLKTELAKNTAGAKTVVQQVSLCKQHPSLAWQGNYKSLNLNLQQASKEKNSLKITVDGHMAVFNTGNQLAVNSHVRRSRRPPNSHKQKPREAETKLIVRKRRLNNDGKYCADASEHVLRNPGSVNWSTNWGSYSLGQVKSSLTFEALLVREMVRILAWCANRYKPQWIPSQFES